MAISTKALLKTEVSEWLDNPSWFASRADNLLILAEGRLSRLLDGRRGQGDTTLTGTVDARTLALPSDFVEPISLWLVSDDSRTTMLPRTLPTLPYLIESGVPDAWAINGDDIVLDCPCSEA